jgi:hypothetical protein
VKLPEARALEDAVDAVFLSWPGTLRLDAGWRRQPVADPVLVHARRAPVRLRCGRPVPGLLLGVDSELFIATALQNAAHKDYRYVPGRDRTPSAFLGRLTTPEGRASVST